MIFPAPASICLARHSCATAPADQNAGEQKNRFLLRGSAGIQTVDSLNKVKILTGDQGLMRVRDANPFRPGTLLHLLDFVMRRSLLPLDKCTHIGFILQYTDNCRSGPFTIFNVGIAFLGVWQALIPLIGHWGEDAHAVERESDTGGAVPFQTQTENILDNMGCVRVWHQAIFVFSVFQIAIDGKGSHEITIPPFNIQSAPRLYGYIS